MEVKKKSNTTGKCKVVKW